MLIKEQKRKSFSRQLMQGSYVLKGSINIDSVDAHFNVFDTRHKKPPARKFYRPRRNLHEQLDLPDLDDESQISKLMERFDNRIDLVVGVDLGTCCASAQFATPYSKFNPNPSKRKFAEINEDEMETDMAYDDEGQIGFDGIQMIFTQREIDAPLLSYRRWLKGRKQRSEVDIMAVEQSIEQNKYDEVASITLLAFYTDPVVKRRHTDSDRKRLSIMDRRADADIDVPAKKFGFLDGDQQPNVIVSLGKTDDRGWRQASRAQSKSYATYAKIRIRHANNVHRKVRVEEHVEGEGTLESNILII